MLLPSVTFSHCTLHRQLWCPRSNMIEMNKLDALNLINNVFYLDKHGI